MRIAVVALMILSVSAAWGGDISVQRAYYRETNASLHLFLTNAGKSPVSILPPVVNGFDTAKLAGVGAHVGSVLWYRCRPNPIPPGGTADLLIVLAEPADPSRRAVVDVSTSTGEHLSRAISCGPERLRFQAIRFSRDLRTVDVYVRWASASADSSQDSVRVVRMDGRKVSGDASPCVDGLAYTRIRPAKPVEKNSYHDFEVETERGLSTESQIRAIPAEFLIGVYGSPTPENIVDWAAHGCNHYIAFGAISPANLDLMSAQGITAGARYVPQALADRGTGKVLAFDPQATSKVLEGVIGKPNLLYHHLVDEPDVSDYYVGRTLGATGMELVARAEFLAQQDPGRYTFIQLDNTFRPMNYRVYGEAADVLATHRYALGNFTHSEAGSQSFARLPFFDDLLETEVRFRQATEPNPFFMVTQFFNLDKNRSGRPPTIEEMRLQTYTMIAGGARGLLHYTHSGSSGGAEGGRTKPLWDAMTSLHAELKRVGEVVSMGTPAPKGWGKCMSSQILVSPIAAGDRMAIIVINLSHRSSLEKFMAVPVRSAVVTVRIPPWMQPDSVEVVPADRDAPIASVIDADGLHFDVDEVDVARCFLVVPKHP